MKETIKLYLTKRIGFTLSILFCFIAPLLYLYFKTDAVEKTVSLKVKMWALVFLIGYLIIILRVLKAKLHDLKNGVIKRFVLSFNLIASFGILWCIYGIIEQAFLSADTFFNFVMTFELIGFIFYNFDSIVNAKFIQEKEWQHLGKEQAKIEQYKEMYKSGELK